MEYSTYSKFLSQALWERVADATIKGSCLSFTVIRVLAAFVGTC
jgi:hypothetical protein